MKIDDSIIRKYLDDNDVSSYSDHWIYHSIHAGQHLFEEPNLAEKEWISLLLDKVINDADDLIPRNTQIVSDLFPDFKEIASNYPLILSVGCPDPYDAMVMKHEGTKYVIFDLMQFVTYVRDLYEQGEAYDFRRILTHELLHVCIMNRYPRPADISYNDRLDYLTFNEGFAHAIAYQENMMISKFDKILQSKYKTAIETLKEAVKETNPQKQTDYIFKANIGYYWDKFGSMSGKLYLLKNKENIRKIYLEGWKGFTEKILRDS